MEICLSITLRVLGNLFNSDSISLYISHFCHEDMTWLKEENAAIYVDLYEEEENNRFEKPFAHINSFVERAALTGLTEVLASLGHLVGRDDRPEDATIDHWTIEMIESNPQGEVPRNKQYGSYYPRKWRPAEIKTVYDYWGQTDWEVHPLIRVACERKAPNMSVLQVLVGSCGVDVNATTFKFDQGTEYKPGSVEKYAATLQYLATKQRFWHLDAIRYLVSKQAAMRSR